MITEVSTRQRWNAILNSVAQYDVFHTYDYHILECISDEVPVLIVYSFKNTLIAMPILIRNIQGTDYLDATSVSGYAGPLSNGISDYFDNTKFVAELFDYFRSRNIISVFSRLNPFIDHQNIMLSGLGHQNVVGPIVAIDTDLNPKAQRSNFSRSLKNHLNRIRRDTKIREAKGIDDIIDFKNLYDESMERLQARDRYLRSQKYFVDLNASKDFRTTILLAECKNSGALMAGCIFFRTQSVLHYHLGGTLTEFIHRMPSKLLIDEMRLIASKQSNTRTFNLGGGLGATKDGLFRFKSSFSNNLRHLSIWKLIVNRRSYDKLVARRPGATDFFPAYRG